MSSGRYHKKVVAFNVGAFPGGEECEVCGVLGVRQVWICCGELLVTSLCTEHARKVPITSLVNNIFNRKPGELRKKDDDDGNQLLRISP